MKGLIALALLFYISVPVLAADSTTQTVTCQVMPINEIALLSSTRQVYVAEGTEIVDTGSTYSLTTNGENKKIVVALAEPLPENVTIRVNLEAPSPGAISLGDVLLSTTPMDGVLGISRLAERGLQVTYKLSADDGDLSFVPGSTILTIVDM